MALQAILQAIAADAEAKAGAILAEADADAGRRLAAARTEAGIRQDQILAKARIGAEHERSRLLHRARLDVSRFLVAAQEDAFQAILRVVSERLSTMRQQSEYPELLAALLHEALGAASGIVRVSVDTADLDLVTRLMPADRSADLTPGLTTYGGVLVSSEDGRVVTHNTLESRLERAMPDLRPLLGSLLRKAMNDSDGAGNSV